MKEKIKNFSSIALGLVLIAILLYASLRVLTGGWNSYKSLSDNVQIAIAVALLSLAGTSFSLYYTKIKDRQLQILAGYTGKKHKLYNTYTKDIINLINDPKKANDDSFSERMRLRFMSDSLLWADAEVLKNYHNFRLNAQNDGSEGKIMYDIATLFLSFRKDLGLSNKNINEMTILEILYDVEVLKNWGLYENPSSKK